MMPRFKAIVLKCDGVLGHQYCSSETYYEGFDPAVADAAALADGWHIERDGELVFCPKCMKKEKAMVPSWAAPNSE